MHFPVLFARRKISDCEIIGAFFRFPRIGACYVFAHVHSTIPGRRIVLWPEASTRSTTEHTKMFLWTATTTKKCIKIQQSLRTWTEFVTHYSGEAWSFRLQTMLKKADERHFVFHEKNHGDRFLISIAFQRNRLSIHFFVQISWQYGDWRMLSNPTRWLIALTRTTHKENINWNESCMTAREHFDQDQNGWYVCWANH